MPVKKSSVVSSQISDKKTSISKKSVAAIEVKQPKVSKTPNVVKEAKVQRPKASSLSVPVYSLLGKVAGSLDLPKEIFGAEVNKALLEQAIRVYQTNLKTHHAGTKTRAEVVGSTRKIYRQKGTGRARHGSIMAPIFVGGGIALGPKYRKTILDLPKKMKKAALISALSLRKSEESILAVSGLDKATGKTKEIAKLVSSIKYPVVSKKLSVLFVGSNSDTAQRAIKNLKGVDYLSAEAVNVFEVIAHRNLILTKEAVEKIQERILKNG